MHDPQACKTCAALWDESRLSLGEVIYQGKFWVVEHAGPKVGILGWLVIVLLRPEESNLELTPDEEIELGIIQCLVRQALKYELSPERVYEMYFAEGPGFGHVHYHMVPKPKDLDRQYVGVNIFKLLGDKEFEPLPAKPIGDICRKLKALMD
jgi:diadenosine tetraphosphate (Ap4A) HIT family hydrolase